MSLSVVLHPDVVGFLRAYNENNLKNKVWQCIEKLKQRQYDSGLRVKKLQGIAKNVWEARVTRAIRLIFTYNKSSKPDTGKMQVYIAVQDICLEHDDVSRIAKARKRTPDSNWLDAEEIEVVGRLDGDFTNLSPIEKEAFQAAELEDLTIPPDFTTDELLGNIQWRVLESEEEWQKAIIQGDADLSLKLTREEYELVHLQENLILSGSAGTGKTTVGLYRLLQSLNYYPSGKRLYVAYNPLLVNNAQEQFQYLIKDSHTSTEALFEFKTIRDLCLEILQSFEQSYDLANEVNFQGFNQLYSRRIESKTYPSFLVWDEIRSIIKGAQLSRGANILSLKDYEKLGKKRSTVILQHQRQKVYDFAKWYQDKLRQDGRFDEIDLAREVLKNLKKVSNFRYQLIVCDEVQDFTELQLELLFQLINSDGKMYFAGDLHQMISPSGFRWEELKQKFYKAANQLPIERTLNFNFRSVSTLVNLANQVLRIRYRLLGETVKGLSQSTESYGEVGRLITATPEKLKLTLNQLNPGEVILFRTDADKTKLCKELQTSLVFTIEEAKGLEFDTVFLVEFFQPQQELWKKVFQGRTLQDKEKPSLQLELNLLYVALTRAKRILNIWESSIFVFWNQPELVGCLEILDLELVREARTEPTAENWRKQGLYYLKAELYKQAIECFEKSGDILEKQQATVKLLLQQRDYNKAAEILAELGEREKAAQLFEKAQQWQQAAKILLELGEWEKAAQLFEKAQQWQQAAKILLELGEWEKAAQLFEKAQQWQQAANCWEKANNSLNQRKCSAKALEIAGEWEEAAKLWEILNQHENAKRCWLKSNNQQKIAEYIAIELEKKGLLSEAIKKYNEAGMKEKAETLSEKINGIDSETESEKLHSDFEDLHKAEGSDNVLLIKHDAMTKRLTKPVYVYGKLVESIHMFVCKHPMFFNRGFCHIKTREHQITLWLDNPFQKTIKEMENFSREWYGTFTTEIIDGKITSVNRKFSMRSLSAESILRPTEAMLMGKPVDLFVIEGLIATETSVDLPPEEITIQAPI